MDFFFDGKLLASSKISGVLDANIIPLDGRFTLEEAQSLAEKIKAHPESLQLKLQRSNDRGTVLDKLTLLDVKTKEPEPAPPACTTTDIVAALHQRKALAMVPYTHYTWGLFDKTALRYTLLPLNDSTVARWIPLNSKQDQKVMLTAWSAWYQKSQAPFKIQQQAP